MHASSPTEEGLEQGLPNVHEEKQSQKYFILVILAVGKNFMTETQQCLTNAKQSGKTLYPGKAWHVKVPATSALPVQGICHFSMGHSETSAWLLSLPFNLNLEMIEPWEGSFQYSLLVLILPFSVLPNDKGNQGVGPVTLMFSPNPQS